MSQLHEFCEVSDYGLLMTKKTDWIQNLSFSSNITQIWPIYYGKKKNLISFMYT